MADSNRRSVLEDIGSGVENAVKIGTDIGTKIGGTFRKAATDLATGMAEPLKPLSVSDEKPAATRIPKPFRYR